MIFRCIGVAVLAILAPSISGAQVDRSGFPTQVLMTRHTYFDFGPPFDYYEVLSLKDEGPSTGIQRILVTPAGSACIQPPTVESQVGKIGEPLAKVLQGKNPCDIPEKDLHKERKRCKHCLHFSGADVTMSVSCKDGDRQIRAELLDEELFERSAKTPQNTSWTMAVLGQIDANLGPGVMEKPAFSFSTPDTAFKKPPESAMLESLRSGKYDGLFNSEKKLSQLYREALEPFPEPSVKILEMTPARPVSAEPPSYPPIARAAHVDGEVLVSFDVSPAGKVEKLSFESGPELLRSAVSTAAMKWQFPASTETHLEEGQIAFKLNCPPTHP